tara:strand:- start:306 stop:2378 length:2073 start_codon:yes stop_codon:yes gene_type:complete
MTTENDELESRVVASGRSIEKNGVNPTGSDDPSGQYPKAEYWYQSSINQASRGAKKNDLKLNGGVEGQDDVSTSLPSDPVKNNTNESESGHVIEIDDTAGGERILIRHRTGAGVEMREDGTIVINTTANRITVVQGDDNVQIEGNANVQYNGNLNVEVTGDYNLDVAGNFNVFVGGDLKEGVDGSHRSTVRGAGSSTVLGARSETTKGSKVVTQLGGLTDVVKGNRKVSTEGDVICSASGMMKMTSETRYVTSSPDINMAAQSLSLFGASGTIGGENVIMYNYNMYTGHSIWSETLETQTVRATKTVNAVYMNAATFEGDLEGTARTATMSQSQLYADPDPGGGVGSAGSIVYSNPGDTDFDQTATAKPNSDILSTYLDEGAYGVPKVKIDIGDHLINALDKTVGTGNVTNKPLTTGEVRSKLRDNGTLNNTEFTASQIATGKLNPEYPTATPGSIGRIAEASPTRAQHNDIIGPRSALLTGAQATFTPNPRTNGQFIPPANYNPENAKVITAGLPIAKGVTIGRFLGGRGEKTNMNHLTQAQRRQVARNLTPQAEAIRLINVNEGLFKNNRLVVIEGLYKKGDAETLTPDSLNSLAVDGRVVVYQLLDLNGKEDIAKMFDLAVYWKDNIFYDQIILDYDKFDPTGKLSCHVIVVMPNFDPNFKSTYKTKVKTLFNGNVQSADSLVEIKT